MSDSERVTLAERAREKLTEKKSVFIATAAPVASEAAARAMIDEIRGEFPDARHHVYAYLLQGGAVARCSDDGEPQGTGGVPVMNVARMSGATDLCIVVTRYFGGILLGAPGLVRAYSGAARLAVEAAGLVTLTDHTILSIACGYGEYQRLSAAIPRLGAREEGAEFASEVTVTAVAEAKNADAFCRAVTEMTGGRARIAVIGHTERPAGK